MKEAFDSIVGNHGLRRRLGDDLINGTLAHAYILAGPHGSGKHSIALQFAAALSCEARQKDGIPLPCRTCSTCRKILSGKSPDVILIQKDGQSVKIEQIRALKTDVFTYPNDLEDKIYVIEDADTMTEAAQNAFLLTLEEPPAFVRFLLLCERPERLLETVRSRAPILRTSILSNQQVGDYLRANNETAATLCRTKPSEFEEILTLAAGSIGRALELCDEKERAPILKGRHLASEFIELVLKKDHVSLVPFLLALPQKRDELLPILHNAQSALRDLVSLKTANEAPLVFYTDREKAEELAFLGSRAALYAISDKLSHTVDCISRNVGIRLALTALLSKL